MLNSGSDKTLARLVKASVRVLQSAIFAALLQLSYPLLDTPRYTVLLFFMLGLSQTISHQREN